MYGSFILLAFALVAQGPAAAQADDTDDKAAITAKEIADQTKQLVRQLNANQAAEREAAEAALVKLGPQVLSHLPTISPRTPAEVKERLGRVRNVLETAIAKATAKPALVTLKGEMPLAEALEALEKQTGNRIMDYRQRSGTVEVDFDKTPYWQALDQILDQVGLSIEEYGGDPNTLVLRARGENEIGRAESATYSGVFRFELIRLESRRDLREPDVDSLRVTVNVTWEPRIKPISLRQALDALTVTAKEGDTLSVDTSRGALNVSAESSVSAVELILPIELPPRDVKTIHSLKGRLTAMVPGSVETFTFDALERARDVEIRNAGVAVTLERVRKNVDLYEVRVRVTYDEANNALESHRGWIFNNDAYVVDAKGTRITNVGLTGTRQDKNEAGVAYLFPLLDGLEGCKFIYKTPALILNLPVEYELKNIQLP